VKTIAVLLLLLTATTASAGDLMEDRAPWLNTDNVRLREGLTFMAVGAKTALDWAMQARGCDAKSVTSREFMTEVDYNLLVSPKATPRVAILAAYATLSGCKAELFKLVDDAVAPRS
jgi:hypothetical protein